MRARLCALLLSWCLVGCAEGEPAAERESGPAAAAPASAPQPCAAEPAGALSEPSHPQSVAMGPQAAPNQSVAMGPQAAPTQSVAMGPQAAPNQSVAMGPQAAPNPSALPGQMPRPYRRRLEAAVSLNTSCVACHQEEAEEWRRSRHRQSNTNAAYRAAFAAEPQAFCQGCHAPESDPVKAPSPAVSELGVGCVTCHVTEEGSVLAAGRGAVIGGAGEDEESAAAPPHGVRRSADFALTGGCAGCHEFRFPMGRGDDDGVFMQTTVREHLRSPAAAGGCGACHMPVVAGRRSHTFAEVRDPQWLRENLRATAELSEEGAVRITLAQPAPGHAFPSGDLFRRVEVGCELRGEGGKALSREVRYLVRRFEIVPDRPDRQLTKDSRVGNEPVTVEMELSPSAPVPRTASLFWWVTYQRVANVGMGKDPADVQIESEVKLHEGALPWQIH